MPANVVSIIGENAVEIGKGTFWRRWSLGDPWVVLRVGARLNLSATSAESPLIGTPRFAMGVCSATGGGYDANVRHIYGARTTEVSWAVSSVTGPPALAYAYVSAESFAVRHATMTSGAAFNRDFGFGAVRDGTGYAMALVLNFDRSAGTMSIGGVASNGSGSAAAAVGVTTEQLRAAMEAANSTANVSLLLPGHIDSSSSTNWTVDEGTYGTLDSVFFHWSRSDVKFRLLDMFVSIVR